MVPLLMLVSRESRLTGYNDRGESHTGTPGYLLDLRTAPAPAHACLQAPRPFRIGMTCLPSSRTKLSMISAKGTGKAYVEERHTEAQMIGALKQLEAGRKAEEVAREVGVSRHTIYAWKAKYGGMDVSQAQETKQLRDENTKLRKLVADLSLDKEALQSVIRKNGWSS
jgi:putative transposase